MRAACELLWPLVVSHSLVSHFGYQLLSKSLKWFLWLNYYGWRLNSICWHAINFGQNLIISDFSYVSLYQKYHKMATLGKLYTMEICVCILGCSRWENHKRCDIELECLWLNPWSWIYVFCHVLEATEKYKIIPKFPRHNIECPQWAIKVKLRSIG